MFHLLFVCEIIYRKSDSRETTESSVVKLLQFIIGRAAFDVIVKKRTNLPSSPIVWWFTDAYRSQRCVLTMETFMHLQNSFTCCAVFSCCQPISVFHALLPTSSYTFFNVHVYASCLYQRASIVSQHRYWFKCCLRIYLLNESFVTKRCILTRDSYFPILILRTLCRMPDNVFLNGFFIIKGFKLGSYLGKYQPQFTTQCLLRLFSKHLDKRTAEIF